MPLLAGTNRSRFAWFGLADPVINEASGKLDCCDADGTAAEWWKKRGNFMDNYCTQKYFDANCRTSGAGSSYCTKFDKNGGPCAKVVANVCGVCKRCYRAGCKYADAYTGTTSSALQKGVPDLMDATSGSRPAPRTHAARMQVLGTCCTCCPVSGQAGSGATQAGC